MDLPFRYRRELEALLREHVSEAEVRAYGSRVSGESHPASDLDLVLRGPNLERLGHGFSDLLEALEESNIPILVQAHDWARLPEIFHREIERHYVVVQEGAKPTAAGEWRTVAFGEVIEFVIGGGWGQETRFPESAKVSVIRGTDFKRILDGDYENVPTRYEKTSTVERRELKPGDVILEISGGSRTSNQSTGRSFLVTTKHLNQLGNRTIPASFCRLLRFDKGQVDSGYAYYSLQEMYRSGRAELYEQQSTGISNFQFAYFVDSEVINLPPLPEQRAIAHVLGTLDDKIELNRRMNQTLEEMARALFKSWFVDFDPVRAKMQGRDTGLPPDIADLFPDRLVPSELGEIPEGWEVKAFSYLLDDVIGGDWGKDDSVARYTEIVSIIRGADLPSLSSGGVGSVPQRYTAPKKAERRLLQDGDIVIEVSGGSPKQPTGRSILVTSDIVKRFPGDVICASFCRRLRPHGLRESILASQHLAFLYSAGKMWDYQNQSTGIANFQTKRFLEEENIVWPGGEIASAFAQYLEPIIRRTTHNESLNLMALRDVLLPKLVSGEVRVRRLR